MPVYNITWSTKSVEKSDDKPDGLDKDQINQSWEEVKKQIEKKGGKITHEFKSIKGATVEFPDDQLSVQSLDLKESDYPGLAVEADQEVRTQ